MWEFGLGSGWEYGEVRLASRLHASSPAGAIQTNLRVFPGLNRVVWPPGTVLPDEYFWTVGLLNGPHFPYGWAVDPDDHT